jgi:hypothetical protein
MSDNTTLKTLFTTLHGSLPYEYDMLYVSTEGTGDSISISKAGSAGIIYITTNTPDDDILDATLYDDANDDEPTEICQWDTNDPNLTLMDLIDHIKKNL